jgi:hypothetical protein
LNNLKFIDSKNLRFKHQHDGVLSIFRDKKYILHYLSIGNESIEFSDEELKNYAQISLDLQCSLRNLPKHVVNNHQIFSNCKFENDFQPIFKYVKPEIFNNYIKKGIWQVGCIEQYRTIENHKQRDEFEGYSFVNMIINNHLISTVCSGGFNYLIFSATQEDNSSFHKNQFGETKIHIPNVKSFAEAIKKAINAKKYYIQKVQYDSIKLLLNREKIFRENISINQILTEPFFEILNENFLYPSLFVKPEAFSPEKEVRIIFEMHKDYKNPLRFINSGLNDHIRY